MDFQPLPVPDEPYQEPDTEELEPVWNDQMDREAEYVAKINELSARINELTDHVVNLRAAVLFMVSKSFRYRDVRKSHLSQRAVSVYSVTELENIPVPRPYRED